MRFAWKNSRGSITLVALSLAVVIGISLASYLALCQQSLQLSTRTLQLSRARQLAETGLEEALWALNTANNPDNTIAATAWTSTTTPVAPITNVPWDSISPLTSDDKHCFIDGYTLGEGATGSVDITIKNFNGPIPTTTIPYLTPIITATATVTVPGLGTFTKTLKATTKPAPLFANALGITNGYNGRLKFYNGGLVDSWDSDYLGYAPLGPLAVPAPPALPPPNRDYNTATPANPTPPPANPYPGTIPAALFTSPSLPGEYSASPATPSDYPDLSFNYAAVVAAPKISLNNAQIRGYAMTFGSQLSSPTSGCSVVAPPPAPGTAPTLPFIDPTRVGKSAFVPNFNVAAPSGYNPSPLLNGSTNLISNLSPIPLAIDSPSPDLTLDGTTVTIKGYVIIRMLGNLTLQNGGGFDLDIDTGARLEIYVGGDVKIDPNVAPGTSGFSCPSASGKNPEPKNLAIFSLNTGSRTFLYNSTQYFYGVIYSASTNSIVEIQSSPEIYGAILANYNIEFDAGTNPRIHYDTALQYLPLCKNQSGIPKGWFAGVTTPFIITQLTETP